MGDRFDVFQLFEGASLMDPIVAKNTSHEDAIMMLEKLRTYPALNKSGEKNIVDGLKRGYRAYRSNARLVPSEFDNVQERQRSHPFLALQATSQN